MTSILKSFRAPILAALIAALPTVGHALPLDGDAPADGYAGLATLTITRSGPTLPSTRSGAAAAISGTTTFVMAWSGNEDYAHSVGNTEFAVDFGAMLPGKAPVSLGRHVFDLSFAPASMNPLDIDLSGPSLGNVEEVLTLLENDGSADGAWTASTARGIFTATYRLFLVEPVASTDPAAGSGASIVQTLVTGGAGTMTGSDSVVVQLAAPLPEPAGLALVGIGLVALAAGQRRKS